jgi:hypothetical protein
VLPLITAIADKQGRDRDKLVLILGELGDSRAIEPLIGTLNDPDKLTQIKAVEALGKLAEKFALPSKDGNWETNLRSLTYCLNFESNPISRVGQVMGFITNLKTPQEQREYLYAINCGLASSNKLTEQFELPLCSEEDLRRFLIILRIQTLKLICTKI